MSELTLYGMACEGLLLALFAVIVWQSYRRGRRL